MEEQEGKYTDDRRNQEAKRLKHFELRSEPIQDILTYIPHGLIRYGITAFFGLIIMLVVISWFIKYPMQMETRITLTSEKPTARIMALSSGKLSQLFVEDGQWVDEGEVLGVLENPANSEDVFLLQKQLKNFSYAPDHLVAFQVDSTLILGELQPAYAALHRALVDFQYFKSNAYWGQQIQSIQAQIRHYQELNASLKRQQKILGDELSLVKKKYNSDSILYVNGAISEIELDNSKSFYLQKKYAYEGIEASVANNEILLEQNNKNLLDLRQDLKDREINFINSIRDAFKTLKSQLKSWEQRFLFTASMGGYVSFFAYWSEDQFVSAGEEVMTIVPTAPTDSIAEDKIKGMIMLPGAGAGRVEVGQRVKIKFDDYPFEEYGAVIGKITSISLAPRENMYMVNVEFPDGLYSTYQKQLDFKQEMQGTAEVVTEELSLFDRIFNTLRSLFDNMTT